MSVINEKRIVSLDALRGLTIGFMILVNTPGCWNYVYAPFRHAKWHGCTPTDLVFPFFLFIVGTAMRFSFSRFDYKPSSLLIKKIIWRSVTIFVIGLMLNAFPFIRQDWDWSSFRVMGVLQRIGIAYGISSVAILYIHGKRLFYFSTSILLIYWFILLFFGGVNPYSLETNVVRAIDISLLGESHLYGGTGIQFDPEGLFSTIPAAISVVFGYTIGGILQNRVNGINVFHQLIKWGLLGTLLGMIWGLVFPINKQIWSSSYVLYTGGIATLFMAGFYWLIDLKGFHNIAWPFVIFGTNSIFVYAASGLWSKSLLLINFEVNNKVISGYGYLYKTVFQPLAGDLNGSFLFALAHVVVFWLLLYWMYRKKIFIKI